MVWLNPTMKRGTSRCLLRCWNCSLQHGGRTRLYMYVCMYMHIFINIYVCCKFYIPSSMTMWMDQSDLAYHTSGHLNATELWWGIEKWVIFRSRSMVIRFENSLDVNALFWKTSFKIKVKNVGTPVGLDLNFFYSIPTMIVFFIFFI